MIFSRLLKGKKHSNTVIVLACISFVVGCIYMYQIPLSTVGQQLVILLCLLVLVVVIALVLVMLLIALKHLFKRLFK